MRASTLTREHEIVRVNKTAKIGMFKQPLWEEVVFPLPECFMRAANVSYRGTLPLPSIRKPKPVDKNLTEAPARYVSVAGIKADGIRLVGRIGMFEQEVGDVVFSTLLPDRTMGTDTVSGRGTVPLPSNVKQKAWKPARQAMSLDLLNGSQ